MGIDHEGGERVTPTISAAGSGTINKPATVIWDYMVAPETLHEWVKDVNSPGEWIDDGKLDVIGSLYRIDYAYGKKVNEIIFKVRATERPTLFDGTTVEGPYPIDFDYRLEESSDGESATVNWRMTARSDSKVTAVAFVLTGWFAKYFMKCRRVGELKRFAICTRKIETCGAFEPAIDLGGIGK